MPGISWQKSSYSGNASNCIELAATPATIHLRESDDPATVLTTTRPRLATLLAATRTGAYVAITHDRRGPEIRG